MDKIYVVTNPSAYLGVYLVKGESQLDAKRTFIDWFELRHETHGHTEWYEDIIMEQILFAGDESVFEDRIINGG